MKAWIAFDAVAGDTFIGNRVLGETRAVVDRHGLVIERRSLDDFVPLISRINHGLTLWAAVGSAHADEVVVQKNLYTLWNVAVDDALDRRGSTRELADSTAILTRAGAVATTSAGAILAELLRRADGADVTPLVVALTEVLTACAYEHACRSHPALAEPERYLRHSATTYGLGVHLAVDLVAADGRLDDAQARAADRAYRELSTAMRCASDVAGLEREREEGSLNLIAVWRRDDPGEDEETLRRRAEGLAAAYLARARELATARDVPGLPEVVETGARIVAALRAGDVFWREGA